MLGLVYFSSICSSCFTSLPEVFLLNVVLAGFLSFGPFRRALVLVLFSALWSASTRSRVLVPLMSA